jgi:hypothetical protein
MRWRASRGGRGQTATMSAVRERGLEHENVANLRKAGVHGA